MRDREGSVNGELVFNRTERAFFYFDGSDWVLLLVAPPGEHASRLDGAFRRVDQQAQGGAGDLKLSSGANGFWDLTGNAATDPAVNFIGTTDAKVLNFRTNNTHAGTIGTVNSQTVGLGPGSGVGTGTLNTLIGAQAGQNMGAGQHNTMLGANAGQNTTTGSFNTMLGARSGTANTTGFGNVFAGDLSGNANTTGSGGVFVGANSGMDNTTGLSNTFVGGFTGESNTTGSSNVYLGHAAGRSGNGSGNTMLGNIAGVSTTTGTSNVFVGESTGLANTTGSGNTLVGSNANVGSGGLTNAGAIGANAVVNTSNSLVLGSINGVNGATANTNVGIGTASPADRLHVAGNIRMVDGSQGSGKVLTSDANGTGTWQALPPATADWGRTGNAGTNPGTDFLGTTDNQPLRIRVNNTWAGQVPQVASSTLAIGLTAGQTSTGGQNTFVGQQSGAAATTATSNTALGFQAAQVLVNGANNAFIGSGAGKSATGSNGTMVGAFAGPNVSTGGSNTFVGNATGTNTTTGGSNTFVGTLTGAANISGNENTLLGTSANVAAAALTNATAIGARASVGTSNSVVLGSINGINGATTTANVGIGTNSPADRLHVAGNIRMVDGNQAANKVMTSDANGTATWQALPAGSIDWGRSGNTIAAGEFIGGTNAEDLRVRTNNVERMVVTSAGNIGIGTATPNEELHVVGNILMSDGNQAAGKVMTSDANGTATWQALPAGSIDWGRTGNAATNPITDFIGTTDAVDFRLRTNNVERVSVTSTGNMGVGTTTPADKLHVAGNIRMVDGNQGAAKVMTSDANGTATWQALPAQSVDWGRTGNVGTSPATNFIGTTDAVDFRLRTNNVERVSVTSTGNMGVGTTAPADRLHVAGNIRMVDGNQATGKVLTSDVNGTGTWQALPAQSIDWGRTGNAGTNATTDFIGTTDAVDFRLRTNNLERLSVTSNGNVGVGTTTPATSLHVAGNVRIADGTQAAGRVFTSDANGTGSWQALPAGTADWGLAGNAGTSAATNFIGTTDAVDFRLRTNNVERLSVSSAGKVGIGTTAPATSLHVNGAISTQPAGTVNFTNTTMTLTVGDRSFIRFTNQIVGATFVLTDGQTVGQMLLIQNAGTLAQQLAATVNDNPAVSNCNLAANRTLGQKDTLTLIWDGTDWIELAFANN